MTQANTIVDHALGHSTRVRSLMRHYGMVIALLALCILFSILTVAEQHPTGEDGANAIHTELMRQSSSQTRVLIVSRNSGDDSLFALALHSKLSASGSAVAGVLTGSPEEIREKLSPGPAQLGGFNLIASPQSLRPVIRNIAAGIPDLSTVPIVTPPSRRWPTFLLADNIRNVASQIAVIAIMAIGMTLVIIAGGIDLAVGSLLALAAVLTASFIVTLGGASASSLEMLLSAVVAILLCGSAGAFSALMVTTFRIPPFIATLAMMQVAAGLAYIISAGKPIYQVPESFIWLGRGTEPLLKTPITVLLMLTLYYVAHLIMTRTVLGRYIYAVGGNPEAARLAGIRVQRVQYVVYIVSATMAGLGGVIMASQLKSGAPTYGVGYELHVIAAVVVGGTSLNGGEGRIFGTLVGALVIGVIQNGMNLIGIESYTQKVILGLVILTAVLLDRARHTDISRWWRRPAARKQQPAIVEGKSV